MSSFLEPRDESQMGLGNTAVSSSTISRSFLATTVPWFICAVGALFYIYEYLLRIAPSVMATDIMQTFHINATQFGNLVAFYYYIYTPMQLVVGILMDRYGPRRLFTVACLLCALGAYMFAASDNFMVAATGRFLIGFGSAFGFVGVLKLATIWLPPDRFALVSGLSMALGQVGAIMGNLLLTSMVTNIGWRPTMHWGAVLGVILMVVIFMVVRDSGKYQYHAPSSTRSPVSTIQFSEVLKGFLIIVRNPQMWLVGLISCLMYLSTSTFAELWGNPYLRQSYHYSPAMAAQVISTIFLGWAIGGPVVGWFSDWIRQRRLPMTVGCVVAAVLIAMVIYVPNLPVWAVSLSFFIFGFFSGAQVIVFAVAREISPEQSAGTAVAVTNMMTMLGGVMFQPLIGKILDVHAHGGTIVNGIPMYTIGDYQLALLVLPAALIVAVFLSFFLQETNCRVKNI